MGADGTTGGGDERYRAARLHRLGCAQHTPKSADRLQRQVSKMRWCSLTIDHLAVHMQPLHRWSAAIEVAGRPGELHIAVARLIFVG